jgi:hypothetical protein
MMLQSRDPNQGTDPGKKSIQDHHDLHIHDDDEEEDAVRSSADRVGAAAGGVDDEQLRQCRKCSDDGGDGDAGLGILGRMLTCFRLFPWMEWVTLLGKVLLM